MHSLTARGSLAPTQLTRARVNKGARAGWIVALLACTLAGAADAQFIARDSAAFGPDSLVTDARSGNTWLNLNVTRGLAYDAVTNLLATDGALAGFRVATFFDVRELFTDAGMYLDAAFPPDADFADPSRLALNSAFASTFSGLATPDGLGRQFRGNTLLRTDYSPDDFIHYNPNDPMPWFNASVASVTYTPGRVGVASLDVTGPSRNLAVADMSTWVVASGPIPPVPEPGLLPLLGVGLAFVAFLTSRRR